MSLSGTLLKRKSHDRNSNPRWIKRFFQIVDSMLIYSVDRQKKEASSEKYDFHPNGVIPLGGSTILPRQVDDQKHAISIEHEKFPHPVILAASDDITQQLWVEELNVASKLTQNNFRMSEDVITRLKIQGLELMKEKERFSRKLQDETVALISEQEKNFELEKLKDALEREKSELEMIISDLRLDLNQTRGQLRRTVLDLAKVEDERESLEQNKEEVFRRLETLSQEPSAEPDPDRGRLEEVLNTIETRLQSAENTRKQLMAEKNVYDQYVESLNATLDNLSQQKTIAEKELKEELTTQLEVRQAQVALDQLDQAIVQRPEDVQVNMKQLKRFFESRIFEGKVDSCKTRMVRAALAAKRSFIRNAMTLRIPSKNRPDHDCSLRAALNLFSEEALDTLGEATDPESSV